MPEKCIKDHVASADASVAHQPPNQTKLSKMKLVILVTLALVAVAAAAPTEEPTKILRSNFDQQPDGRYEYGFESDDGTVRQETGELREAVDEENKTHTVVVVRGFYNYINADGTPEKVEYYADETGFHPEGNSIPKAARR